MTTSIRSSSVPRYEEEEEEDDDEYVGFLVLGLSHSFVNRSNLVKQVAQIFRGVKMHLHRSLDNELIEEFRTSILVWIALTCWSDR